MQRAQSRVGPRLGGLSDALAGEPPRRAGYLWSLAGVAAATGGLWLVHRFLDKGQESLLYLPVVIACALRFGFGPAVLAAVLSFFCWNFFFLPPAYTLIVHDPKDWISLFVFVVAAVTTAQLAARARQETALALAREAEVVTLFEASEAISREVSAERLLAALTGQFQALCRATHCLVLRRGIGGSLRPLVGTSLPLDDVARERVLHAAELAGAGDPAWERAGVPGVFVPLHAADTLVGVLHVGPREDGRPYAPVERRLILTLANHAATVIAREELAEQAAQAAALREADTLKDSLLSLVSHELRTPLAAIKASATGLLQPGGHWDELSRGEALGAIDREADRLNAVVNNLLDLSRLEAGVWRPEKDWCDLGDVLATVLDRLPEATAGRVQAQVAPELPLIRADFTQVALVLENLLGNAAKYAPEGPITVRLAAGEAGGVRIEVRDHGPGIEPGEAQQLFVRFFRGARHRDGAVHGTGLGLALCAAIVHAHGGSIAARNAPDGPGALFRVELPVSSEDATGDSADTGGGR